MAYSIKEVELNMREFLQSDHYKKIRQQAAEDLYGIGARTMEQEYHCSVHGEITDVIKMAFNSSVLRDPDTKAWTRIERLYCTACYIAFLDAQLDEVTEIVKDEEVATD